MATETDVLLLARPSAAQYAAALVGLRLPRWGLDHIAPVVETLASDLTRSVVDAIGLASSREIDPPMLRCVLWSQPNHVGFAVEEPTQAAVPKPALAAHYPGVRWGQTVKQHGKATWFMVPLKQPTTLGGSPSSASETNNASRIPGTGQLPAQAHGRAR